MKDYLQLIDDTIAYIESLIPKRKAAPKTPKTSLKPVLLPKPSFKKKIETLPPPSPKKREEKKQERRAAPPPNPKTPFCKIASSLKAIAPNLPLLETPPSDEKAKRIRNSWREKNRR